MVTNVNDEANEIARELERRYRGSGEPVEVKFRHLCAGWPWAKRSDVLTHLIHPYSAKVLPYIPIFFLTATDIVRPDDRVVDMFAGSGTVLLEASTHPYYPRTSYGVEINPLGRLISKVKTKPLDPAILDASLRDVLAIAPNCQPALPSYSKIDFWFPRQNQSALGRLREAIDRRLADGDERDFFRICLAVTVRRCSFADPDIPPPVRLAPGRYPAGSPRRARAEAHRAGVLSLDPLEVFRHVAERNISRMERLWTRWRQTPTPVAAHLIGSDARHIRLAVTGESGRITDGGPGIPDGYCGAVITSPPYGSAQKYVRNTKLEMIWLGLVAEGDIASLDYSSIGTEKSRHADYSDLQKDPDGEINAIVEEIADRSPYRAALTLRYLRDMREALREASRILRVGGHLVMVVGDNLVAGIPVYNHSLLPKMAAEFGLSTRFTVRDKVESRGMITIRHQTGGLVTHDWTIVLQKTGRCIS